MFSVCVCVFWIFVLNIFLIRDDFRSLKCCLDHWLYSMLDCIYICVFLILKNCFYIISIAAGHLSIVRLSIELFNFFLSHSRQLLDSCLIHRDTFWLLDSSLTATSIHRAPLLWKPLNSSSIVISRTF